MNALIKTERASVAKDVYSREDVALREKLDELGLNYEVMRVNVSSVDTEKNEYQTRQHSIVDRESVERFKMSLASGSARFPEMLLAANTGSKKTGPKSLVAVCGRHRIVAHKESGVLTVDAIIVYVKSETDKEKLVTISRWDNFRNGTPETIAAHYQGLAQECISLGGGVIAGYPPRSVIDAVALRNNLNISHKSRLVTHIKAMLFQAECRSLRIHKVPDNIHLCSQAHDFIGREGFEDVAKAVCANHLHKGITGAVKDARSRKLFGSKAASFIKDSTSGFSEPVPGMTNVSVVRLRCRSLIDSIRKLESDPAVTAEDIAAIERLLEESFDQAVNVTSHIKERRIDE